MKRVIVSLMYLLIILNICIKSFAVQNKNQDSIYLNISNTEIKNGEEFSFTINLANIDVTAFDIHIYFNNELLEYISGPENTNVVDSKIITVWYDETGGKNTKQNCELVKYTFKAKKIGSGYIAIQGDFYNTEGIQIQSFTDGIEMIANEETQTEMIEVSEESQVASNNSKLKTLRLNHEGMTPIFSPDITEYYFLTEDLSALEVTATPENPNAKVTTTGNTNFKDGLNIITVEVTSQDETSKTIYTIFVTKTKDLEKANTNLETLAIENVTLEPEFSNDIYQYNATVSNNIENINILAIPEKQGTKVEVTGGKNLQYGKNVVNVQVMAENGYTIKQYRINIHRRNEEEQQIAEEEIKMNVQKLNAILEEQEEGEKEEKQSEISIIENIQNNLGFIMIYIIFSILIIIIVIYRIKKEKMGKNKV